MELNLGMLISDLVQAYTTIANQKNIHLAWQPGPQITAELDADLVARAVSNLLDNAIRHAPEQGQVQIKISENQNQIEILVTDDGPGIPAANKDKIFDPLVSFSQDSANRRGLGLAFCRLVAQTHHGSIRLDNNLNKGAGIIISLPKHPPRQKSTNR